MRQTGFWHPSTIARTSTGCSRSPQTLDRPASTEGRRHWAAGETKTFRFINRIPAAAEDGTDDTSTLAAPPSVFPLPNETTKKAILDGVTFQKRDARIHQRESRRTTRHPNLHTRIGVADEDKTRKRNPFNPLPCCKRHPQKQHHQTTDTQRNKTHARIEPPPTWPLESKKGPLTLPTLPPPLLLALPLPPEPPPPEDEAYGDGAACSSAGPRAPRKRIEDDGASEIVSPGTTCAERSRVSWGAEGRGGVVRGARGAGGGLRQVTSRTTRKRERRTVSIGL